MRPATTAPASAAQPAGLVIADRFDVLREIGRGERSVIYGAIDRVREEEVALKLLPAGSGRGDDARTHLDALASAKAVRHPNLVELHGFGVHEDQLWASSELLAGRSVAEFLAARRAPVPLGDALAMAAQAAAGLTAAHCRGVVHADIKASHVFLGADGQVRLLDTGLPTRRLSSHATAPDGLLVGTPAYLAPERIRGVTEGDELSDLYALGVVIYELFTGQRPFRGKSTGELFRAIVKERPPAPRRLRPDLPSQLEDLTLSLLHKEPRRRPRDGRHLAGVLQRFAMLHSG